ncbi:hypothetical protein [Erythrobacter litoralis]|uniref:Lipoprotein n=1 Tax=Erythrobacter litoralis (strain HTCC2594) TaxID=314225 RepID=Q2N899_ERYLH|nr:hypothetical protein [Erythrobacter litoralis]ABC64092.1 hypothetical protein ELI_10000 [Erythrobacter litoralis HTCC2594]
MKPASFFILLALAIAGCAGEQSGEPEDTSPDAAMPVEPDGGIGDGATPLNEATPAGFERSIPQAVRGQWREDDLGRAPTAEDCDQTSATRQNFGKVLRVRADGFSLFEQGGRLIEVHNRTDTMIDATFDTTYADTPTQARLDLALQADGTLAINRDDGDGRLSVTQYRKCPE